jgi:hypothetical protein
VEVALAVAAGVRWFAAAILRAEALPRGLGFDQCAIHREMFVRQ